jgi:multiple sugar transport system substrate-binding protein
MRKTMKRTSALVVAGIMALSLAACGGAEQTSVGNETDAAVETKETAKTEEAAETQETAEDVTIKITWWGSDTRHAYTQELLALYESQNPHVKFEATPSGWDGYFERLSTQAAAGSMPDIIQMDYAYISTFSTNDSLADLSEYVNSGIIDVSAVDESILGSGQINGKTTGIPLSTSILAVTYNPVVIQAAGATEPTDDWTWDDYVEMNKKVAAYTGQPSALNSITGPFGNANMLNYWIRQHGATLYNDTQTALGYEDDGITAGYFKFWADLADQKIAPNPDEQSKLASVGKEALPIMEDKAATTVEWNNFASMMSGSNDTLKLALMPGAKENNPLWLKPGMFFSVAADSQVKEECAKFINWFINSEEANAIIAGERGTPVSAAVREYMIGTGTMTPQQVDMFEYVDKAAAVAGVCPPADPNGQVEIDEAFANAGNSVMYGQATPEDAAKTFREQANIILQRNNQ